jgi:hypothetical protein
MNIYILTLQEKGYVQLRKKVLLKLNQSKR